MSLFSPRPDPLRHDSPLRCSRSRAFSSPARVSKAWKVAAKAGRGNDVVLRLPTESLLSNGVKLSHVPAESVQQPSSLPRCAPDSLRLDEFLLDEQHGRQPFALSRPPLIHAPTGFSFTATEIRDRSAHLAAFLAAELDWLAQGSDDKQKVAAVFSVNNVQLLTITCAIHRLGGIVTPSSSAATADELASQLKSSGADIIFASHGLLDVACEAAARAGISKDRIFVNDTDIKHADFRSVDDLVEKGRHMAAPKPVEWKRGDGARKVAYLCYSSGTSGLPKAVMISHTNCIANVLQMVHTQLPEQPFRKRGITTVTMSVLPHCHMYSLLMDCLLPMYRGDSTVFYTKYSASQMLEGIQKYRPSTLTMVPPIIIDLINKKDLVACHDRSSVKQVTCAAAPLQRETVELFEKLFPNILILQSYGMTETAGNVCNSSPLNHMAGSVGIALPWSECRLVDDDGKVIDTPGVTGELLVRSPCVFLGYMNNKEATDATFRDGWMRTGDMVRYELDDRGQKNYFVVDRLKEIMKVKGFQVAPAELEAHLLQHPAVSDAAVISVPDVRAGELPKAYIVRDPSARDENVEVLTTRIHDFVREHKSPWKWLAGGIVFVDAIPKSPSGKILRRKLR